MKHHNLVAEALKQMEVDFVTQVENTVGISGVEDITHKAKRHLADAMLYSLTAGGKRIRPMLVLEMAMAYGGKVNNAMSYAAAIEMIHTYSLIHDDLPCMDDDDLRRGKPTNHVIYGEDIAVLAGDALLNLASELMLEATLNNGGALNHLNAMREIMRASGANGMILGQVADIKYHDGLIDVQQLDFINHNKTGRLLTAAIVAGAYLGGASESEILLLRQIGADIGKLFQVVDDVLDVEGSQAKLGKRTQIDVKNQKTTYPNLLGMDQTKSVIKQLTDEVNEKIEQLSIDVTFLKELVTFLANRDH